MVAHELHLRRTAKPWQISPCSAIPNAQVTAVAAEQLIRALAHQGYLHILACPFTKYIGTIDEDATGSSGKLRFWVVRLQRCDGPESTLL